MLTLGLRRWLCVTALLLFLSPLLTETALAAQAISVSPTQGLPSSLVIVSGSGWPKGDMIDLWWNSDDQQVTIASIQAAGNGPFIARIKADDSGAFTTTVVVKKGAPGGPTYVNAGDQAAFLTAQVPFNVKVLAAEPFACADAYFIGVHGTTEGPDGPNKTLSKTIGETWENFYGLAAKAGKTVNGYAIDYFGSTFAVLSTSPLPNSADSGAAELDTLFYNTIWHTCSTPHIVLAGYSLGAWVIDKWIVPTSPAYRLNYIRAVALYGDPMWHHGKYDGIARRMGKTVTSDPYTNTPPGYKGSLADRWQSRCLQNDAICGEGEYENIVSQAAEVYKCLNFCEHWKYMALSPKRDLVGYGLTKGGADFLASKAFQ